MILKKRKKLYKSNKETKKNVCFRVLGKICKFCMILIYRVKPWLIQISFDNSNSGESKYQF